MSQIWEKRTQPITRDVLVGVQCDHCGRTDQEMLSPIRFSFDPSEEAEILIEGDICYDCLEQSGDMLGQIAEMIRALIPHGSVRSATMMGWDPTGVYADD